MNAVNLMIKQSSFHSRESAMGEVNGLLLPRLGIALQPIVSADNHREVHAYEALLRINSGHWEMSPEALICAAEIDGSITALDRWVLRESISLANRINGPMIWTNVSQISMADRSFVTDAIMMLTYTQMHNRISLEITETADGDLIEIESNIKSLHLNGVSVVIDDLWEGFSKTELLEVSGVTACKLSKTAKDDMKSDLMVLKKGQALVKECRRKGQMVVLEGVETQEDIDLAGELGVTHLQGFLIGFAEQI